MLLVASALCCTAALAQWQWVDSAGRKVFSDTPPPVGVSDKNILKRPGLAPAPAATETANAPATTAPATTAVPKLNDRDEQLEARKKQAEAEEQAKKKAEDEKVAKARQDNCERAKRNKITMDSGIRIATTNAKGEREIMDDKARAAENQRLNAIIQSDCGAGIQ
ncbi:DUF4124 domain-containing protein [Hydrogenophaga sp.]|uniref:DUF4124 domain-containing protein n=1 Tax=Hydrogenophaga sp. TaxID=1904254 RepID=UPI0025BF1E07|nr:DUF4124 domain-containing protein [Hydrogenophaga sp.]